MNRLSKPFPNIVLTTLSSRKTWFELHHAEIDAEQKNNRWICDSASMECRRMAFMQYLSPENSFRPRLVSLPWIPPGRDHFKQSISDMKLYICRIYDIYIYIITNIHTQIYIYIYLYSNISIYLFIYLSIYLYIYIHVCVKLIHEFLRAGMSREKGWNTVIIQILRLRLVLRNLLTLARLWKVSWTEISNEAFAQCLKLWK